MERRCQNIRVRQDSCLSRQSLSFAVVSTLPSHYLLRRVSLITFLAFFRAAHTRIYCSAELFLSCLAGVTICTSLMLVSNQAVMQALLTQKIGTFKHFYSISLFFLTSKVLRGLVYSPEPLTCTFLTRLKEGGVCTFVKFCCDTIFQTTKD